MKKSLSPGGSDVLGWSCSGSSCPRPSAAGGLSATKRWTVFQNCFRKSQKSSNCAAVSMKHETSEISCWLSSLCRVNCSSWGKKTGSLSSIKLLLILDQGHGDAGVYHIGFQATVCSSVELNWHDKLVIQGMIITLLTISWILCTSFLFSSVREAGQGSPLSCCASETILSSLKRNNSSLFKSYKTLRSQRWMETANCWEEICVIIYMLAFFLRDLLSEESESFSVSAASSHSIKDAFRSFRWMLSWCSLAILSTISSCVLHHYQHKHAHLHTLEQMLNGFRLVGTYILSSVSSLILACLFLCKKSK